MTEPCQAANEGQPPNLPVTCNVSYSLTIPRIVRCEKDLDALFGKVRDLQQRMDGVTLSHEDSAKRLSLMEDAVREQQKESQRTHLDIETLKNAVRMLGDRLETVISGMHLLAEKFDTHSEEFKQVFLEQAKAHESSVARHAKLSKRAIQVAAALAMTGIAFTAVHAAITGESIFASMASYLALLVAK